VVVGVFTRIDTTESRIAGNHILPVDTRIRPKADNYRAALEDGDAEVGDIPDSLRRRHFGTQAGVALSATQFLRPVGLLLYLTALSATPS
jgi:hypothetical protein